MWSAKSDEKMCFWDCYHPFLHPCNMIRCVSPACVEAKVVVREFVKSQGLPTPLPLLKTQPVGGGESRCLVVEPDHLQWQKNNCQIIVIYLLLEPHHHHHDHHHHHYKTTCASGWAWTAQTRRTSKVPWTNSPPLAYNPAMQNTVQM